MCKQKNVIFPQCIQKNGRTLFQIWMEMWEPWKTKNKKITALHPVSFYGNVEGGYPNCRRARGGEVVSSEPPVSTLEPTTFLLWGGSNSQMEKTLQNTYSQTWSWQQHAAGCCSVTGSHRSKDGCRKIQWKLFFQSAPDLTFQKLKKVKRKQCLQKALSCCVLMPFSKV